MSKPEEALLMNQEKLHCCEKCHIFWTCETKWYRGERNEENICCPVCNFFRGCPGSKKSNKDNRKK